MDLGRCEEGTRVRDSRRRTECNLRIIGNDAKHMLMCTHNRNAYLAPYFACV
jgi:hypothetical protein